MSYELKGIALDKPHTNRRIRLFVRGPQIYQFSTFTFPDNEPFNREQILKFIAKQLDISQNEILWPEHIQIPQV